MGQTFIYKCSNCGYEVETSGKKDFGMRSVVKPYICNDCKVITDVLIGEFGEEFSKDKKPDGYSDFYKCTECGGENISVWNTTKKPCPKCGSKMKTDPDSPIMLWD